MTSTRKIARIAGLIYLVQAAIGYFNIMYVPDTLIVRTDPTATANNIATHDLLFRLGIVSDLLVGGASTLSDLRAISYVRLTDGELREIDLPALYERYQSLAAW